MYQLIDDAHVRYLPEGAVITLPANESYGWAYEKWLAEGNTPKPVDLPSAEQLASAERAWRNAELLLADIEVNKAFDAGADVSRLSAYRQALRDWPESERFPDQSYRPIVQ